HGRSGRIAAPCTLADLAGDVVAVWGEAGVARPHLAGFSPGGLIAQSLAPTAPPRTHPPAVTRAGARRPPQGPARAAPRPGPLRTKGIAAVPGAAEERWFTPEFRASHPDLVATRMAELLANHPSSYAAAYTVFATSDLGDRLHDIRHPTLVVTGENDVGSNTR